jgi:hypothetical protein
MAAPNIKIIRSLAEIPPSELNLGLVVEVPREGDEGAYRRAANPSLDMNPSRWLFVSDIHIVMPNFQQVYLFRTLQHKHYHCDKDKLEAAILKSGLNIQLHVHEATENVTDHPFVRVMNVGFDLVTEGILSSIPWKSIANTLYAETVLPGVIAETSETIESESMEPVPPPPPKRQQYHKDVGFTSGRSVTGKDELGVNLPVVNKPMLTTESQWLD